MQHRKSKLKIATSEIQLKIAPPEIKIEVGQKKTKVANSYPEIRTIRGINTKYFDVIVQI